MIARRTLLGSALAAPFVASLPRFARASAWPAAGPIRLVVAQGGGGNADVVARILVDALEPVLGQRVLVENNGSASGMRAAEDASNAEPDGRTLLVVIAARARHCAMRAAACGHRDHAARGGDDRRGAHGAARAGGCAGRRPRGPQRLAADPAAFQQGSGPARTTTHTAGALCLQRVGAEGVVHIPYPRSPEAMADLIAGRPTFVFDPSLTAIGQAQGGAAKALGVSAPGEAAGARGGPDDGRGGAVGLCKPDLEHHRRQGSGH